MGSDIVSLGENESFFYGFCAAEKVVADHLNRELSSQITDLQPEESTDYPQKLATMMEQLMEELYDAHKATDPCNLQLQNVLISFAHLIDTDVYLYGYECTDNGTFKLIDKQVRCFHFKPESKRNNFFISLPSSTAFQSETFDLISINKLARRGMLNRPKELAERIIKTDTSEQIRALILLRGNQWLETCKCPATTKAYKSLKKKWNKCKPGLVVVAKNELEKEILEHRYDSAEELVLFEEDLRKRYRLQENAPLENQAPFVFLAKMIAQKQAEEAASMTVRVTNALASLFKSCNSR